MDTPVSVSLRKEVKVEATAHRDLKHWDLSHLAEGRSPAQLYALAAGVFLTVMGVAGFFVNSDFSTGSSVTANTLVVFDVNGWLNLVNLLTGVVGIYVATRTGLAKKYALTVGVVFIVLAAWGVLTTTVLGLLPMSTSDMVLYAGIGALGLMTGLGPDGSEV